MPNNNLVMSELSSWAWAMEPRRLVAFISGLGSFNNYREELLKVASGENKAVGPSMTTSGGVAVIPINGILMQSVPKWFAWFDIEATAYGDIISMVKTAAMSSDIERIHLQVNSPGGTVAGGHEAAQAIFDARKAKAVTAHINDLGASGAFQLASQANSISAGPNAEVGSIGIFCVVVDSSKRAEDEGIKVHVIRSGPYKGMGVPGDKITKKQIDSQQLVVDGMADNFIRVVARGRGKKEANIRELATGETFIAKTALKKGLIDSVVGVSSKAKGNNSKGANTMAETEQKTEPEVDILAIQTKAGKEAVTKDRERLTALRVAFPDDPDFAMDQFEKGASVIEAKAGFADVLAERLKEANAQIPQKKANADGAEPVDHSEGGNTGADFMVQATAMAAEEKISKSDAIRKLQKTNPDLYEEYRRKSK